MTYSLTNNWSRTYDHTVSKSGCSKLEWCSVIYFQVTLKYSLHWRKDGRPTFMSYLTLKQKNPSFQRGFSLQYLTSHINNFLHCFVPLINFYFHLQRAAHEDHRTWKWSQDLLGAAILQSKPCEHFPIETYWTFSHLNLVYSHNLI